LDSPDFLNNNRDTARAFLPLRSFNDFAHKMIDDATSR